MKPGQGSISSGPLEENRTDRYVRCMRLLAPAKINLHLRVAPPRADGFHPLLSWMCTVHLFDTLDVVRADSPGVSLTCDHPTLACDESNLIVRIGNAFAEALRSEQAPVTPERFGARIELQKRLPMGGGVGGGSSDAAATLSALASLWNAGWDPRRLADFASRFGSDIAFFLHGPSAVCTGRGEVVRPIAPPMPSWALLVLPEISMPTPAVYRRFDEMKRGSDLRDEPDWKQWTALSAEALLPRLVNDLEGPAFSISPELGRLRVEIEQIVGRPVRMSGSGSTLFTLFDDQRSASSAAELVVNKSKVRAVAVRVPGAS